MDPIAPSLVYSKLHSSITELLLIFLVTLLCGIYIYTYLKNKPKNYPAGPTGLPIVGYLPFLGSEPHKTLWKLKEKYGDIIGLHLGGKYTVVLNDWSAVKEVLTHTNALDRAPNIFDHIPQSGFISVNGREWLEQRRFCLSASRDLGVGKGPWENIISEEVHNIVEEIQKSGGKPIEISRSLSSSISSNIVSFLIGRRLTKEKEPETVQLSVDFSDVSFTYMGPSNATSVLPWLRKYFEMFKIAGYDKAARVINNFCNFVKGEISRHKISPEFSDVNDFINSYLSKLTALTSTSNSSQHYFSENMLVGNVNILFLGASDTIFSSLGWLFRLMAEHQDIQQKVHDELITALGKDGVARYEEREKIPYTFAVIMESQRYSSIVPLSTTRCASQDITVRGYTIPRGTEIFANLWALHNDPKYWDEPEKFKPERFLVNGGNTLLKSPQSYAPFSIGRRNCPGETIAWMEIISYFSEIIKRFEISVEPGKKPEFNIVNGLVAHLKPQPLCFKERIRST